MSLKLWFFIIGFLSGYLASAQPIRMVDVNQRADVFHTSLVLRADESVSIRTLLQQPEQYSFSPIHKYAIQPRSGAHGYWLRFDLTNETDEELFLQFIYNGTKIIDVYETSGDTVLARHQLGSMHAERDNPVRKSNPFCALKVWRGQTHRFYVFQQGIYTNELPIYCLTATRLLNQTHRADLFFGLFYGMVLSIILYALLLFVRMRDRDTLLYAIWVFFVGAQVALFRGHLNEFLYAANPAIDAYGAALAGITGIAHIPLTISFLHLKRKASWFYRAGLLMLVLYGLGIAWLFLQAGTGINREQEIDFIPMVALLEGAFNLAAGVYVYRRGFRPAIYYVWGNLAFFASIFVFLLYAFGPLPHNFLTYNSLLIGTAVEVTLFATALASKINLLKEQRRQAVSDKIHLLQENERLVTGQNAMLEQKVAQRTTELEKEKQRSEELLLNILPEQVVEELKKSGLTTPRRYEQVTVMFMDIQNFTDAGERLAPEQLVSELDFYFRAIDSILSKYRVEKIKTIGDAYLCAGGVPIPYPEHADEVVQAALEIRNFLEMSQLERQVKGQFYFSFRIGIHTGPLVAGVVGARKFAYDIWGDTVNMAARMEQHGEAGKVNISETTFLLIKDRFRCSFRGKIAIKHKGNLNMYFAESVTPELKPQPVSP
ncbi:hypothetical protein GCM10023189_60820 [Nibrella saemangeumensis]|uniref:Guanylate cyclase domain-containing protein n=1 Tax=Nibrella saemangeumensis TaxID=1084526 RepID=A0ABP8NTW7_9BACT